MIRFELIFHVEHLDLPSKSVVNLTFLQRFKNVHVSSHSLKLCVQLSLRFQVTVVPGSPVGVGSMPVVT